MLDRSCHGDVEQPQTSGVVICPGDRRRLHHHDCVELQSFGGGGVDHGDTAVHPVAIKQADVAARFDELGHADEICGRDHQADEQTLFRQSSRFTHTFCEQFMPLDPQDPRFALSPANRPGWLHGRGRRGQELGSQVEDLTGSTIPKGQLVVPVVIGCGQMAQDVVPRGITPRSGGLCQVAENGQRPARCPTSHHSELHGAEILGLVNHDVPVGARSPVDEILGLVEQGEVIDRPRLRPHPLALGAQETAPLGLGHHPVRYGAQPVGPGQELAYQRRG